ncbi:hypothetical protein [Microvirga sp. VF16]|uniref:hypothetical protein n=1 Tax=Microvirga sp. VF16 TaxID=2807101 RepID=UPI00193D2A2E|nr:hypothetical protein [Microvirga sp. VF16]QRM32963.1 hypothetical protein JO965_26900 [Microvirga sp. VF16]
MTDTQIFAFLVLPFLLVLTCGMVFFSGRKPNSAKPADPPEPMTRPNSYTRKSRRQPTVPKQVDAAKDWPRRGLLDRFVLLRPLRLSMRRDGPHHQHQG